MTIISQHESEGPHIAHGPSLKTQSLSLLAMDVPPDTPSTSVLNKLPVELLLAIVQHLTSLGDLLAVRDTSRLMRNVVGEASFRTVCLERTLRDANALGRAMSSEELSKLIQHISFDYNVGEDHDEDSWRRRPGTSVSPLLIETDSLFQAFMTALLRLSRATSLQSIHLTFSKIIDMKPVPHVEELFTYPITFQQRLLAVLARSAPLTLTSLVLENITPIPHSVYQSQNFANVMEQLTTFSLSTASRSKKGSSLLFSNAFADFWYTTVPSMLCRAKNLESLTLESGGCEEGFVPIEVGIRCLWLPRLKTLNLHNISFGLGLKSMSECRLEDFILRHSSTLEHLDLHGCFLWVMGHSPRITWGAMFDRFAENLPSLKRFIVFRSGVGGVIDVDAPLMQKYGSFGYSKDNVPPYVAQDDAAALQRLVAVSRARAETRVHSLAWPRGILDIARAGDQPLDIVGWQNVSNYRKSAE